MSKTAIVKSGENFFIKQLSKSQPIKLDRVIFANVSGINSNTDINADEKMPASNQIVHTASVTQSGLLNDRTVVYSVILDTNVGDFSFNYIGLVNAETNTLCMVMHTDLTKKIKTAGQRQGNTITESIWLEMDNASESTGVTVNAQTWQIDYSKRLAGEDERIRLTNYDLYNRLVILNGFTVTKNNNQLNVSPGLAYVAGLRVENQTQKSITVDNNQSLYIEAWLAGTTTGEWTVKCNLIAGANLRDYHDGNFQHYVERIASVDNVGNLIKVNPKSFVTTFDLASLTKIGIVKLSSAIDSTSETEAATPRAIKAAYDLALNANNIATTAVQKGQEYPFHGYLGDRCLNDLGATSFGIYYQNSYAKALIERGYPIQEAGALSVLKTEGDGNEGCVQVYTIYKSGRQFIRNYRGSNTSGYWENWIEQITTANINTHIPAGVPLAWPTNTPPSGWFECNGSTFDKNQFPKLGATYPSGILPDLRGVFIRGLDTGSGLDPNRGILSYQGDAIRNIWGEISPISESFGASPIATGAFRYFEKHADNTPAHIDIGSVGGVTFDASRIVPTANENRPCNIAFMYIVKAE